MCRLYFCGIFSDNVTFLMCEWIWDGGHEGAKPSLTKMSPASVTKIVVGENTGSDMVEISISEFFASD